MHLHLNALWMRGYLYLVHICQSSGSLTENKDSYNNSDGDDDSDDNEGNDIDSDDVSDNDNDHDNDDNDGDCDEACYYTAKGEAQQGHTHNSNVHIISYASNTLLLRQMLNDAVYCVLTSGKCIKVSRT